MSTEYHQIMTECVIALRMGLQGNASRKLIEFIDHISQTAGNKFNASSSY